MGKSNRIRNERIEGAVKSPSSRKKGKGMPNWLMTLIAVVITVAVLATVAIGLLSSNGVFGRMSTAMKSDHYRISRNMMSYYYNTQYQNFYSSYSNYMSYFSLDTSKSLKDQTYGVAPEGGYAMETNLLGAFEGTWFDYFMTQTKTAATGVLVYCEEANARGLKLTDDETAEIDAAIEALRTNATTYNYTLNAYIAALYGEGVKEADVRKAMELSALSAKCQTVLSEEFNDKITDGDIDENYASNKLDYNVIDYSSYTFRVNYDTIATEVLGKDYTQEELNAKESEVLEKYRAEIAGMKELANHLESLKTPEEFENYILSYVAGDKFDDSYDSQDIANEDKLESDSEKLKAIRDALIEKVIAEVLEDKESTESDAVTEDEKTTVYGQEVSEAFAKVVENVKKDVFSATKSAKTSYRTEKANYIDDDSFYKWAFEDGRAANDTHQVLTGDGSEEGEVTKKDGYFYASVYLIRKPQYMDVEKTRNVAYMLFSSEEEAKAAIEALAASSTVDYDTFAKIAKDKSAVGEALVKDYTEGSMKSDAFDKWIYGDTVKIGDYTETPINMSSSYYAVAYYDSEGNEAWYVKVKAAILNDRLEANYKNMEATYEIVTKDKTLNKIGK